MTTPDMDELLEHTDTVVLERPDGRDEAPPKHDDEAAPPPEERPRRPFLT